MTSILTSSSEMLEELFAQVDAIQAITSILTSSSEIIEDYISNGGCVDFHTN